MRNKISKIEVTRRGGYSIIGMKLEGDFISFEKLSGRDLYIGELATILFTDKDVLKGFCRYIKNSKREGSFNISTVIAEDKSIAMALRVSRGKFTPHYQVVERLKIFNDKTSNGMKVDVNKIENMYIGDLFEFILEAYRIMYKEFNDLGTLIRYLSMSGNELRDERKRHDIKYIKPSETIEGQKAITVDEVLKKAAIFTRSNKKFELVKNKLEID